MVRAVHVVAGLAGVAVQAVPTVTLSNGIEMPRVAVAPMKVDVSGALIGTILDAGLTHIFTAEDYFNQDKIRTGLAGRLRSSFFLTSMTSPCIHSASEPNRNVTNPEACYQLTLQEIQDQLDLLGVDALDLVMLHGPSRPYGFQGPCGHPDLNLAQWRAYADMQKMGKAKAIGVSNFCQSCLEPLIAEDSLPNPSVNQLQYHIGMGPDFEGIVSYLAAHSIELQSYSPLASGELVHNNLTKSIGAAHNKSSAQVALRWITQRQHHFVTGASKSQYMMEDADTFEWDLTKGDLAQLDAISCNTNPELCTQHAGTPSWGCTQYSIV